MQRDLDSLAAMIRAEKDITSLAIKELSMEIKALREDRIRAVTVIAIVGVIAAPLLTDFLKGFLK